jgi:membrane-associated phospholipid phosphatase
LNTGYRAFRTAKLCAFCWVWSALWGLPESRGSDSVQTAGDILQFALPASAFAITLAYQDGRGALEFGESAVVTLGVTYGLKYTVNETRPNGGSQSFPSAHTSISFSAAEFMRKRYGWEYGIPAYAAASFVAYSRVEAREHYAHDVIAGAAIGIVSSYIFTKPYRGWHVQVEGDSRYLGVRVSRNW